MKDDVVNKVKPYIEEIVNSQNLNLYELAYVKEDGNYFLRVSIEKKDGTMDFETAEIVSDLVSAKLDELDPIEHEYILDVCSPGAEKPIRNKEEFIKAINQYISVYVKGEDQEKPTHTGYLLAVNDASIEMSVMDKARQKKISIELESIKKAHLAIKF